MSIRMRKQKKANIVAFIIIAIFIVCLVTVFAVVLGNINRGTPTIEPVTSNISSQMSSEEPIVKAPTSLKLLGVGDNLIHEAIYNQARERAGGVGYDFKYPYEKVAGIIKSADIASINQETVMADIFKPSAYPMFNSPTQLGKHLVEIGFDVFNLANNHVIDKGEKGILSTLDFWRTQPVKTTGVYQNSTDYDNIRTVTKNDITVGFVGITEMTNGLNLPSGSDVMILKLADEEKIKGRILKAKEISDAVVVNVHWGAEYTHEPGQVQRDMAKKMIEWGADVILGHHPHVIQPVEYIKRSDGTQGIVAYSLGNFISAQEFGPRMLGGMLELSINKEYKNNTISISDVKFLPIVTHYGSRYTNVRTYPLDKYTNELASKHGCKARTTKFSLDYINGIVNTVIDKQFLS